MTSPSAQPAQQWLAPLLAEFDRFALAAFQHVKATAKPDGSVVTELDKAVSALTKRTILARFPGDGFLSEEEPTHHLPDAEAQWVLDPIDGTASFVRGYPVWGFGLGLLRRMEPWEGYLHFPLLGETLACAEGRITVNGRPFEPPQGTPLDDTRNLLIGSTLHGDMELHKLHGIKLRNAGSNLYHMASVALGRAEGMITQRCYLWDLAAGLAFTRARGCVERYVDGSPFFLAELFRDGTSHRLAAPLVIGPPGQVEELLERLA